MNIGVALPLGILLVVFAGIAFGIYRSGRRRDQGPARTKTSGHRAAAVPSRGSPQDMPLAHGGGAFACRLAGTAYRQDTLAALRAELLRAPRPERVGGGREQFVAELRADPTNPHDREAVSVEAPGGGAIGWLPRGDGARYLPLLESIHARRLRPLCPAELCKGPDGSLAVRLDLGTPAAVAARLGVRLDHLQNMAPAGSGNGRQSLHASH
jgi:hypothetical protein